ncbi:mechanosensitive ion channel [Alphaproteobacteria bacterium]|nr:mechanosensitive ion channel [Alphaproteobacteria bacterium]
MIKFLNNFNFKLLFFITGCFYLGISGLFASNPSGVNSKLIVDNEKASLINEFTNQDRDELNELLRILRDSDEREDFLSKIETLLILDSDTFSNQPETTSKVLSQIYLRMGTITEEFNQLANDLINISFNLSWLTNIISDNEKQNFILLIIIFSILAFALWFFSSLLLGRPLNNFERIKLSGTVNSIIFMFIKYIITSIPTFIFFIFSYSFISILVKDLSSSLVLFSIINSLVVYSLSKKLIKILFIPSGNTISILPINSLLSAYCYVWLKRFSFIVIYGWTICYILFQIGLDYLAYLALLKILFFLLLILTVTFILQNKSNVSEWLNKKLETSYLNGIVFQQLSEMWHILIILYMILVYFIWALGVSDGFIFVVASTVKTILIICLGFICFAILKRLLMRFLRLSEEIKLKFPTLEVRSNKYFFVLEKFFTFLIIFLAIICILQSWSIDTFEILMSEVVIGFLSSVLLVIVILALAFLFWEIINLAIDKTLSSVSRNNAGARIKTLLPLARNAALIVIVLVTSIIILSEFGINVAPILAGAGVLGLAIGFGAQTLVKDIITGAFIIFENTLTVGDVVELAGHSGVVEEITIRTISLRDLSGTVHTVPFSSVDTIINMTRDYAYVVSEIGIAYKEDTDHVITLIKESYDNLLENPDMESRIIGDLEIMGLERFDDSAVIIRLRIKTSPGNQWSVKREFNRLLKYIFDDNNIEMPFPHSTIYFGEDNISEEISKKISKSIIKKDNL